MSILSIQSHVAYGYVGNKAAVYPLQAMGYDVWPVNTVQFSNHTGYGKWQGDIFSKEHIHNIIQGIIDLGVANQCQAILSGYMGSSEICFEVTAAVAKFKKLNNKLFYLCDPVIGNTSCFVKPEVLEFFKTNLQADIITPNQFEAEILSGIKITKVEDLKTAAKYFHGLGIGIVVITGLKINEFSVNDLQIFVSDGKQFYTVGTKEYAFAIMPNGTGDLFSAVFLGSFLQTHDAILSLRRTVYFTDLVMQNTFVAQTRELKVTSINYSTVEKDVLPIGYEL